MKDIKEMLESGKTPEELREILDKQIKEAQEEIDRRKRTDLKSVAEKRYKAAVAMTDYINAAKLMDDEVTVEISEKTLKELEEMIIGINDLKKTILGTFLGEDWHKDDDECDACKCDKSKKDLDDLTREMLSWIK